MSYNTYKKPYNSTIVKNKKTYRYDKKLIGVNLTTTGGIQNNTILYTCTYPCVVMGLVIRGSSLNQTGENNTSINWVVSVVHEGEPPSNINFNGDVYTPEQDVMCFGCGLTDVQTQCVWKVKTKTGRKLMGGDIVGFSIKSLGSMRVDTSLIIQFFLKI